MRDGSFKPPKRPKSRKRENQSALVTLLGEPPTTLFPSKRELLNLLVVVGIASFVAVACNCAVNFFNRKPSPFCDSGSIYLDPPSDFCEPCPKNGQCFDGNLECSPGYKKIGRSCVEDGEINQTARKIYEWIEDYICKAYVQLLCDATGKIWFNEEEILMEIKVDNLMDQLGSKNDIFMLAKPKAMENVAHIMEKKVDYNGIMHLKCPELLANQYKPIFCSIRQWFYKNLLLTMSIFITSLGVIKLIWKIRLKRQLSGRVEELYEEVCDILEENALSAKQMKVGSDPWVVASQLRDHLLLPKERKNTVLWKKVEELVQEDSRIDQYPRLVTGESKVVWEWQVDGSLSSRQRKRAGTRLRPSEDVHWTYSPLQRQPQETVTPQALG